MLCLMPLRCFGMQPVCCILHRVSHISLGSALKEFRSCEQRVCLQKIDRAGPRGDDRHVAVFLEKSQEAISHLVQRFLCVGEGDDPSRACGRTSGRRTCPISRRSVPSDRMSARGL